MDVGKEKMLINYALTHLRHQIPELEKNIKELAPEAPFKEHLEASLKSMKRDLIDVEDMSRELGC